MKSIDFAGLQEIFDVSLNNQVKFYCLYMPLWEVILLFVQATREQSWESHLYCLYLFCL